MKRSSVLILLATAATNLVAAELRPDLGSSGTGAWVLPKAARLDRGELVLDGRDAMVAAFYEPALWGDVRLEARFFVEPASQGVLACGFIVRAQDAETWYAVHFDREQAILIRSDQRKPWNEIHRKSGLDKPPGRWHHGTVECTGDRLKVSLNGTLLYEARDATLASGRIGFYASQGLVRVKDIAVSGSAGKPAGPFVTPPHRFVYVSRDGGAGGYEAFPDICRLADGRLMCVFYAGHNHVSLPGEGSPRGGLLAYSISSDEGRTWSAARTLYDGPGDDRDPSITQLPDGRLLCTFFALDGRDQAGKYVCRGTLLTVSEDAGKTWSEPRLIAPDYYCSSPVRVLSSGRLMLGIYAQRGKEAWGAVTWSDNDGETWAKPVDIPKADRPMAAETDVIELRDGTLFAALRCDGGEAGGSFSRDDGRTWSVPHSLGFTIHCPYLHRTPDGSIVLAGRHPATSLRASTDECRTWGAPFEVDAFIGAYPSIVTLRDRSMLIVYYEEGTGSNIRGKRFVLEGRDVRWLSPADPAAGARTAPSR